MGCQAATRAPLEVLHSDHEGTQHAVARFTIAPGHQDGWTAGVARHWRLDGVDPRG